MTTGREPLTHEERELAARLARLGAPDGPSPALDAKILAAAHDEALRTHARAPASRRPRNRQRWPVAIGAVASLVVVLGIAWQLRPEQESEVTYSESDFVRAPRASGPSAAEELPVAGVAADEQATPLPPQPAPADAAAAAAPAAATAQAETEAAAQANETRRERADAHGEAHPDAFPTEARKQAAPLAGSAASSVAPAPPPPPPEQAPEDQIVFDAPAPVAAPAPPPPPAPAASTAVARDAAAMQQRRQAPEKTSAEESTELDSIEVTGTRIARDNEGFTDAELDDQPPATADSTQVQRAWLQRIREMLAEGDEEGAKASLAEFKRRNPRYALPEDLQALLSP